MELSKRRKQGEMAEWISVMAISGSGDKKSIQQSIKKLTEESQ